MTANINPLDDMVALLNDHYLIENVGGITPTIAKIYEKPTSKEPKANEDHIFVYSESTSNLTRGLGANNVATVNEIIKIDIRVRPSNAKQGNKTNDVHARAVLGEVYRILYANIKDPSSNFDNIDPNITHTDLSNGNRGLFRYVLRVTLNDWCRDMTAL